MCATHLPLQTSRSRGFTLLELMVTIAIVAILGALAVPSLRTFFVRNSFSSIGNEFNGSILRARNEALSKNMCITMCRSTNADSTSTTAPPACDGTTTDKDWQKGWIVFMNPACDASLNTSSEKDPANPTSMLYKPENMILARLTGSTNYTLVPPSSGALTKLVFNPRGQTNIAAAADGLFILTYVPSSALTTSVGFNICVDILGRTRSVPVSVTGSGANTCANY